MENVNKQFGFCHEKTFQLEFKGQVKGGQNMSRGKGSILHKSRELIVEPVVQAQRSDNKQKNREDQTAWFREWESF